MKKFTENFLNEEIQKQNRYTNKTVFINIAAMNVALIIIVYVLIFSVPEIISANTVAVTDFNNYEVTMARRALQNYHDTSINPLVEEEINIDIEELLPKPTYEFSDSNWYMYEGHYSKYSYPASKAWSHAFSLRARGLTYGASADYQCTFFAQMWFYDNYGYNSTGRGASGNGENFAMKVYEHSAYYDEDGNLQHYFQLGDHPMTLGIVSIYSSAVGGHVLCVDEVDYENNTITISEGNVTGSGDVRIRQTMSLDQFYALNPGRKVYANPTKELFDKINEEKASQ